MDPMGYEANIRETSSFTILPSFFQHLFSACFFRHIRCFFRPVTLAVEMSVPGVVEHFALINGRSVSLASQPLFAKFSASFLFKNAADAKAPGKNSNPKMLVSGVPSGKLT